MKEVEQKDEEAVAGGYSNPAGETFPMPIPPLPGGTDPYYPSWNDLDVV